MGGVWATSLWGDGDFFGVPGVWAAAVRKVEARTARQRDEKARIVNPREFDFASNTKPGCSVSAIPPAAGCIFALVWFESVLKEEAKSAWIA
jgi:hypothetical protein